MIFYDMGDDSTDSVSFSTDDLCTEEVREMIERMRKYSMTDEEFLESCGILC